MYIFTMKYELDLYFTSKDMPSIWSEFNIFLLLLFQCMRSGCQGLSLKNRKDIDETSQREVLLTFCIPYSREF